MEGGRGKGLGLFTPNLSHISTGYEMKKMEMWMGLGLCLGLRCLKVGTHYQNPTEKDVDDDDERDLAADQEKDGWTWDRDGWGIHMGLGRRCGVEFSGISGWPHEA